MKKFFVRVALIALVVYLGSVFVKSETHADLKHWWDGFVYNATGFKRVAEDKWEEIQKIGQR